MLPMERIYYLGLAVWLGGVYLPGLGIMKSRGDKLRGEEAVYLGLFIMAKANFDINRIPASLEIMQNAVDTRYLSTTWQKIRPWLRKICGWEVTYAYM
jgi:hypothetical protein